MTIGIEFRVTEMFSRQFPRKPMGIIIIMQPNPDYDIEKIQRKKVLIGQNRWFKDRWLLEESLLMPDLIVSKKARRWE